MKNAKIKKIKGVNVMQKIFNIPLSCSFLDVLAEHFLAVYQENPLALADVLFLLPNRRACQSLTAAFVRRQGLKPTILPQMQPIAEVEEDELQITGFDVSAELSDLPPAISATERQMLFTKILMAKPTDYGLEKMPIGQAAVLAGELASFIDMVYQQELSFDNLQNIVPEEYAAHWQETLKFLKIITDYWPAILSEKGKVDSLVRKHRLLGAQLQIWQKVKPSKHIVVAGTTAAFPLMKELVRTVLSLEHGEVFLSGIDKYLSDDDWAQLDELHPQYELKQLLDYLQIERWQISDLVGALSVEKENFIAEVMRPAVTSDKWRHLQKDSFSQRSFEGIHLLNVADMRSESLAAALMMREVLNEPEKTAALVTTDRTLARCVASELARWNIAVDDSAGCPLGLTPVGIFLRQIITVIEQNFAPVAVLGLMKYPFYANGVNPFEARRQVRAYERYCLRQKNAPQHTEKDHIFTQLQDCLQNMCALYQKTTVKITEILKAHLQAAEVLATTDCKNGAQILWKNEDGETAAKFMADLLEYADVLGEIQPEEYGQWLGVLMGQHTVRRRFGAHPRLKILGPLEARLQHFDRVIIGEVNEGSWPQAMKADPWMSRPMKKDFGMPLPEKNIGVQAADFSALLANAEVFVLRADRVQGTPMVKSRWLMRMETVLQAIGFQPQQLEASQYGIWAKVLDKATVIKKISPPAPKPPVSARPRELPASAIENWMRDPYMIFAKYILQLKPLDELEQDVSFADYGTLVHAVLEEFNNKYPKDYPDNAKRELLQLGESYFMKANISEETKAFWWPNFLKTIDWVVAKEESYRQNVAQVYNEVKGKYSFDAPAGRFVVTAKADRVDITKDGKVNIIDYKTGQARSAKEIEYSYAPQLPIEALIAEQGGFEGIPAAEAEALIYWQLGRKESGIFSNVSSVLQNTYDRIRELVALFDFENTPYFSKPNFRYAPKYSDYEQLSRIKEIALGNEDEK